MQYTPEQVADIEKRESDALEYLKKLQLSPAVQMHMVNVGDDNFAIKPMPYLQDLKFASQPSPIQPDDLTKKA